MPPQVRRLAFGSAAAPRLQQVLPGAVPEEVVRRSPAGLAD